MKEGALLFFCSILTSCQTAVLDSNYMKDTSNSEEYGQLISVKPMSKAIVKDKPPKRKEKPVARKKEKSEHLPKLEDSEGFLKRRPLKDPFRVGERVRLRLTYFGVPAGFLSLEVRPFVKVNGRKSYEFVTRVKSNGVFSLFYSVDDVVKTHVDYETLLPYNFSLDVKESKQLVKAQAYYNSKTNRATYWEKKITEDKGIQEMRKDWSAAPYSQNVFSAAFYMRTFTYRTGKKLTFRVADKGENIVFTGHVLRRERIKTKVGELDTIVVQPRIGIKGAFKSMGEILFWLTDDDRKLLVKLKSKIQIGSIVGYLDELKSQ